MATRRDREADRVYKREWRRRKAEREGRVFREYKSRIIEYNPNLPLPEGHEERIAYYMLRAAQGLPLFAE